ncbi:hypothetical protein JW752_00935 [Candidatus Peregrinibacteria bacterium]|nr:hypothetical protein [Candidatus Peregrinibacteria bacterium]
MNTWFNRARPQVLRPTENPTDLGDTSFPQELWRWVCGPKPSASIGLAILALWVTIALYAILIIIGVRPSYQYAFAFPLMYGLLRWSFDGVNGGR